jgi:hypothetical protein
MVLCTPCYSCLVTFLHEGLLLFALACFGFEANCREGINPITCTTSTTDTLSAAHTARGLLGRRKRDLMLPAASMLADDCSEPAPAERVPSCANDHLRRSNTQTQARGSSFQAVRTSDADPECTLSLMVTPAPVVESTAAI